MKRYLTFDKNFNLKTQKTEFKRKKIKSGSKLPLVNIMNIGYYILTPLLVGVFLGISLDKYFRLKGVFVLVFIFLGTAAAFYNLYQIYKNGK